MKSLFNQSKIMKFPVIKNEELIETTENGVLNIFIGTVYQESTILSRLSNRIHKINSPNQPNIHWDFKNEIKSGSRLWSTTHYDGHDIMFYQNTQTAEDTALISESDGYECVFWYSVNL